MRRPPPPRLTALPELKRALHLALSAYGRVLDVVLLKTAKLAGQAWVVFADVPSATAALRALQGFTFYDRPLVSPAQSRRVRPSDAGAHAARRPPLAP